MPENQENQPRRAGLRSLPLRITAVILILIAVIAVLYLKFTTDNAVSVTRETGSANAADIPQHSRPKLLDLGADKCVACKAMVPVLASLRQEYGDLLEVEFIDVWQNGEAAEQHQIGLIPTQIWFAADGTELERHEGFISKEDILAVWKRHGYDFTK